MASDAGGGGGGFPEALFTIVDDPVALRASVDTYRPFARQAQATRTVLRQTTVPSWVGAEGDEFRRRRAEYEPMVATGAEAFESFVRIVRALADDLETLRTRMMLLRDHAREVWARLQAASAALAAAADRVSEAQTLASVAVPTAPGARDGVLLETTRREYDRAADAVGRLSAEWERCVTAARRLHHELRDAAECTAQGIGNLPAPPTVPAAAGGTTGSSVGASPLATPPKPLKDMTPTEVRTWWLGLTPAQRTALGRADPRTWGNQPGVPTADRDRFNRLTLQAELSKGAEMFTRAGLRVPTTKAEIDALSPDDLDRLGVTTTSPGGPLTPPVPVRNPARAALLERFASALALREQQTQDEGRPTGDPRYLYVYEPESFDGRGRTAVAVGDPEKADNTSVLVGGLTTRTSTMGGMVNDAARLQRTAEHKYPAQRTAVLVWQGYDAPQLDGIAGKAPLSRDLAVVGEGKADAGARRLAKDVADLRSLWQGGGSFGVIAHSYGSTTAGLAAHRYGMAAHVDRLTLLGSPGPGQGVHSVDDLHLRTDQVFVGSAGRDLVTQTAPLTGGLAHGDDPASDDFRATRIKAESAHRGERPNIDDHTRYLFDGGRSESETALAEIIAGHPENLGEMGLLAEPRHTEIFADGTVVAVDPELDRAVSASPTEETP